MNARDRFIEIYKSKIKRDGAEKLLEYLISSDFFTAPASAKYHSAYEGGLLDHSLNVYDCLCDYLNRDVAKNKYNLNYSDESIAIVSLLHDLCKVNVYKVSKRNVKNKETGKWEEVDYYEHDDKLPYGHGEKSVYMINGYLRLTREEALAINWHMGGFDKRTQAGGNEMSASYYKYPICVLVHLADIMASYLDETRPN
jgi:hypothetical protein